MDETFAKVVQFFMTFVADNCKKSTVRELPNIMGVYNLFGFKNHTNQSLVSKISDQQMAESLRRGLEYIKGHISQLQALEDGIPVTGGSIESWRFENIALDIISQDTRLHNTADFQVEGINVNMNEGKFHIVAKWPAAHLTETYILRGSVDNKRVYGAGRFRISVLNFVMTAFVHFQEENTTIKIKNVTITGDFEDARINISGLEVEGNENAEQLMNNAIQRDKQKFREILHRNMDLLSKEVMNVLNSKLVNTHKNTVFNLIASWFNL
ncbi:uncharacterized protein LOC135849318 [Planococcus citri]|uniref:uncharacterized protein LOC135849318 n=1 Tax=Planococcus citri TaxID=170843 RepID=UPI0031F8253F